jgi:hypothetical protein
MYQVLVAQKVAAGVYRGVTTTELDELAAETVRLSCLAGRVRRSFSQRVQHSQLGQPAACGGVDDA